MRSLVAVSTASLLAVLAVPVAAQGSAVAEQQARLAIEQALEEQAGAWSRGDLESFCSIYAEDATFVSPSGITRGRHEVLERYRRRYPDAAAMGRLSLAIEEVRFASWSETGREASVEVRGASLVARWRLDYPDREAASGLTLLVFRPRPGGGWEIVQDASF